MNTTQETCDLLQAMLVEVGLPTDVVAKAKSGSCYLRFDDSRMGQIRIGDHDERECYGYRWHIRLDIDEAFADDSKGHNQFFYPAESLGEAVMHMLSYSAKISR